MTLIVHHSRAKTNRTGVRIFPYPYLSYNILCARAGCRIYLHVYTYHDLITHRETAMQTAEIEEIYRKTPLEKIPWNIETPPDVLVRLVQEGTVQPCRAIDCGCGAGNYAVWLAGQGFEVTGIDSSPAAIALARELAAGKGARCTFVVADLLGDLRAIEGTFDFAYDYELLHHLLPKERRAYMTNLSGLTRQGAAYLSVCFSEEDPQFGGKGKTRRTPVGTILYFSSEAEIRDLVSPFFEICSLKTIDVAAKTGGTHRAICMLGRRR
jgi:SAM-dependent methyltransferase